jgi:hypothetical protein
MANLEKHKKSLTQEWTEAEDSNVPAQSRSPRVLGAYIKIPKAASPKARRAIVAQPAPRTEAALAREPAPPKPEERVTQSSSPDHLRKTSRTPRLRAPYSPRSPRG